MFVFFLILLRPPRSSRTDTHFPYTSLTPSASRPRRLRYRIVRLPLPASTGQAPIRWTAGCRHEKAGRDKMIARGHLAAPGGAGLATLWLPHVRQRSEEHTSELQSLMRISYAVFCLKTKKHNT